MLSKLRGLLVLIQFSLTIAVVIALMYIFPKKAVAVRKFWMKIQISLLGIKFDIHGKQDPEAKLTLMNHQSLLDIVVMEYLDPRDIAWVAKKEIAQLFFFGHILKAPKMIIIDRENKTGLIKLLKEVKDRISHNRPIAMFPEGTRSDGSKLGKFKAGAKLVAKKQNLKVQPVLLFNTRDVLDSKSLRATPGVVKVIYLESIDPNDNENWYEDLETQMNKIFNKEIKI